MILDLLHFLRELGIESPFAMRFLKPGVQWSGSARPSGMQYLSTSNVVLGMSLA